MDLKDEEKKEFLEGKTVQGWVFSLLKGTSRRARVLRNPREAPAEVA